MCGRFANTESVDMMSRVFAAHAAADIDFAPSDDCRPTQPLPIVLRTADGRRHLRPATWGLCFDWAKRPLINARVETAASKPSFATLLREQRCLVPASAFYEWHEGVRVRFALREASLFAMAGLWQRHDDGGRFTILTTGANALVAPVHERMPVILRDEQVEAWLACEQVEGLAEPFPAERMSAA